MCVKGVTGGLRSGSATAARRRRRPRRRLHRVGLAGAARRARARAPRPASGSWRPPPSWATAPTAPPACSPAAGATCSACMLDVRNPFHAELVEEIHAEADGVGYEVVLSTLTRDRDEDRAVETLLDFRCEAVILLGPDATDAALGRLAAQVPVRGGRPPGRATADVDVVRPADDVGVDAALRHLIGLGHRRIAFVDGGRGAVAAARRRGYRDAMRRAGLADEIRIIAGRPHRGGRHPRRAAAGRRPPTGRRPWSPPTTGSRSGCMDALRPRRHRRARQDISIVGYDDSTPGPPRPHRPDHGQPGRRRPGRATPCWPPSHASTRAGTAPGGGAQPAAGGPRQHRAAAVILTVAAGRRCGASCPSSVPRRPAR